MTTLPPSGDRFYYVTQKAEGQKYTLVDASTDKELAEFECKDKLVFLEPCLGLEELRATTSIYFSSNFGTIFGPKYI